MIRGATGRGCAATMRFDHGQPFGPLRGRAKNGWRHFLEGLHAEGKKIDGEEQTSKAHREGRVVREAACDQPHPMRISAR